MTATHREVYTGQPIKFSLKNILADESLERFVPFEIPAFSCRLSVSRHCLFAARYIRLFTALSNKSCRWEFSQVRQGDYESIISRYMGRDLRHDDLPSTKRRPETMVVFRSQNGRRRLPGREGGSALCSYKSKCIWRVTMEVKTKTSQADSRDWKAVLPDVVTQQT